MDIRKITHMLKKLIVIPSNMQTEDEVDCVKYMVGDMCSRNDYDGVRHILESKEIHQLHERLYTAFLQNWKILLT